jgi:uncharacterized OsmC-like protein
VTARPLTYEVHGRSTAGGSASVRAGHRDIPIDARWPAGEPSGDPGPAELLASAFAACLIKNLERASAMLPFRYDSAEVTVRARRQDAPPRFVEIEYELRIVTQEEPRRVDLVHRNLRQFGTVYNTLAAVCEVHGTAVAVPPGPASGARPA